MCIEVETAQAKLSTTEYRMGRQLLAHDGRWFGASDTWRFPLHSGDVLPRGQSAACEWKLAVRLQMAGLVLLQRSLDLGLANDVQIEFHSSGIGKLNLPIEIAWATRSLRRCPSLGVAR